MVDKIHSIQLVIDAAGAESGRRQFTAAIEAIKKSVAGLDRDTRGAFTQLGKSNKLNVDSKSAVTATSNIKTMDAALKASKAVQLSAQAALRTSQSQFDRLYEKAQRLGDTSGIASLNRDLAQLQTKLARTDLTPLDVRSARSQFADGAAGLISSNRALELQERQSNITATATANLARETDNLRAKYNPLYAASQTYATALQEIARAEQLGAISTLQAADARQRAAQSLAGMSNVMGKYGAAAKVGGYQTANIAAQLQDVAVTAQMGMSPLQIALQQGTQLGAVFTQMSGQGVSAAAGLRAAFASLITPTSLLTIGIIAGGAALIQMGASFFTATDKGVSFKDQLQNIKDIASGLDSSIDTLSLSVAELEAKYGGAAIAMRDFAILQAELRVNSANAALNAQSSTLADAASKYYTVTDAGRDYANTLNRIKSDFGLSTGAAREFESALTSAATSTTLDGQTTALTTIQRLYKEAGVAASEIPPEIAAALQMQIELTQEATAAKNVAERLADAVADVAPNLSPAITTATALKNELAAALALFNRVSRQRSETYSGRGDDPRKYMPGGSEYGRRDSDMNYGDNVDDLIKADQERLAALAKAANAAKGGGRRSRGDGKSDAAKEAERLTESIQRQVTVLQDQANAAAMVAAGQYQTAEAAQLAAEAMRIQGGAINAATAEMLAQIDAMTAVKEAADSDPLRAYVDSLPTFAQGVQQVKADLAQGLESSIADGLTNGFDPSKMLTTIRASLAKVAAQQLVSTLLGSQLNSGLSNGVVRGSQTGAQMMGSAITTAGAQAAQAMAAAISTGRATAGATGAATGATGAAAGGGGGIGGLLSAGASLLGGFFKEGGYTTSPVTSAALPASMFAGAPHYAEGTANTSGGIPAILHDNEAVIPLSRGRKVPVEVTGEGNRGGSVSFGDIVANVSVTTSGENDADPSLIARAITESVEEILMQRLSEQMAYGGMFNPRGG